MKFIRCLNQKHRCWNRFYQLIARGFKESFLCEAGFNDTFRQEGKNIKVKNAELFE